MADDIEIQGRIIVDDQGTMKIESFNKALGKTSQVAGDAHGKMGILGSAAQHLGNILDYAFGNLLAKGLEAAGNALMGFGKAMFSEAMEAEDNMAQLNAVLTSTKGAAGMSASAINNLATELSGVTRFTDDAVIQGESLLLTFTNIGQNVFPDTTKTMLDMSQALGQDLKTSAIQLGKALQDPIVGVSALKKVGVNFTDAQKDMIEKLVKTGKLEEAQSLILKELQTEFGGSAEAAGKTFAGRLEILKNKLANVEETLGSALMPALEGLVTSLSDNVAPVVQKAAEGFQVFVDTLLNTGDIGAAAGALADSLTGIVPDSALQGIRNMGDNLNMLFQSFMVGYGPEQDFVAGLTNMMYAMDGTVPGMADIADGIVAMAASFQSTLPAIQQFGQDLVTFLAGALAQIWAYLGPALGVILQQAAQFWKDYGDKIIAFLDIAFKVLIATVGGALELIVMIIQVALTLIKGILDVATAVIQGRWQDAWNIIKNVAITIWNQISTAFTAFMNLVLSIVGSNLTQFTSIWKSNFEMAYTILKTIFDGAVEYLQGMISRFTEIGKNLILGLKKGMEAQVGAFLAWLTQTWVQVQKLAEKIFGVKSPSTVFADIGKNLMLGLEQGIQANMQFPMLAMAEASDSVVSSATNNDNSRNFNFFMQGEQSSAPSWFTGDGVDRLGELARQV